MENEFYLQQQQQNLYNLNSYLNNNNWDTSFHSTLTTSVHPQPQADPLISTDPSFVERAARLSMFGRRSFNGRIVVDEGELELGFPTVSSCQGLEFSSPAGHDFVKIKERIQHGFSPENGEESSSVSEPQKSTSVNDINPRKRKSNPRAKSDESDETEKSGRKAKVKPKDDSRNSDEPTKDYIHVRARRGQATDSHSLAERVRREKISQRMKFLQDLVPGCNKVTGKAMMLDEIINYVQSLQRQVEFLSMKLSIVNPTTDINIEVLLSKDLHRAKSLLSQSMLALETSSISPALSYGYPSRSSMTPLSTQRPNNVVQLQPSMDGFDQSSSQVSLWIDELHNVVQMGHGQNELQKFLASLTTSDTKMK